MCSPVVCKTLLLQRKIYGKKGKYYNENITNLYYKVNIYIHIYMQRIILYNKYKNILPREIWG